MQERQHHQPLHGLLRARMNCDALLHAGQDALGGLDRQEAHVQHGQRDDRRQERERVQPEAPRLAQLGERQAAQRRAHHTRHVELNRLERDGVGHVLFVHQVGDQRLVGRAAERLREARDERAGQDVPDVDGMEPHQHRQHGARSAICTHCEPMSRWRRSMRSAMTPPISENRKIGSGPEAPGREPAGRPSGSG